MTAVAAGMRRAVELAGVRPVEAYYLVQVATSTAGLDAAATIIKSRRGRILSNEAREGQDLFIVTACMPVEACLSKRTATVSSAGERQLRELSFADDLRRETSGDASASLAMSHWERLQVDPSWKPTSEEEREEHGEEAALLHNIARRLANVARLRKGLPQLGGKVIGDGTKQRTRARAK
jgi:ribosome assembly protein 1